MPPLLTQTREVWVVLRPLVAMHMPFGSQRTIACAKARQITHVGTLIGAYKGNLGAKVLLFFDLCKIF
jgi:hypothetical protein